MFKKVESGLGSNLKSWRLIRQTDADPVPQHTGIEWENSLLDFLGQTYNVLYGTIHKLQ
jgi:hypothetical protein